MLLLIVANPAKKGALGPMVLLLTILYSTLDAQESKKNELAVKFHPIAMISIPRFTALFSADYRYDRWGVEASYGQQWAFLGSDDPDTILVDNFGNRYGLELRYFLGKFNLEKIRDPFLREFRQFLRIGYGRIYSRQNITVVDFFSGYRLKNSYAMFDNIHVIPIGYGVRACFGRFINEASIATGIRLRTYHVFNTKKEIYTTSQTLPHLSFSVRLGFLLR